MRRLAPVLAAAVAFGAGLGALPASAQTPAAPPAAAKLRAIGPPSEDPARLWTVLVHMNGDNDLEKEAMADLNEIEAGLPASGVEVIVLVDRCAGFDKTEGDWTEARLLRLRRDGDKSALASTVLARLGEIDMADPEILAAFLEGAFKAFPARRRMLVMWDHGSGWASLSNDHDDGRGKGSHMTLPGLGRAVRRGLEGAGLAKLGLIGFDMCLMGQLETAVEIGGMAEVMVASENMEPGAGWPYDAILPLLADPAKGPLEAGRGIVEAFDQFYDAREDRGTTLAAMDLSALDPFLRALDGLLAGLEKGLEASWSPITRAFFFSESYASRLDYLRGPTGLNSLDLMDMMRRIRRAVQPFPAEEAFQAFQAAFSRLVPLSRSNADRRLSQGLAVYAPVRSTSVAPGYDELRLGRVSRWPAFLSAVYARQDADKSEAALSGLRLVDGQGRDVEAAVPLAGHFFKARIEGRNIAWTWIFDGSLDEAGGETTILSKTILTDPEWLAKYEKARADAVRETDLDMLVYKDGATDVSSEFEGLRILLTNGRERSGGTVDVSSIQRDDHFVFRARISHSSFGSEPVEALLFLDRAWFEVVRIETRAKTDSGAYVYREIDLDKLPAETLITPLHEVVDKDGKMRYVPSRPLAWREGLGISLEPMAAGTYRALLSIETLNGRRSRIGFRYNVAENKDLAALMGSWAGFKPEHLVGSWDLLLPGPDGKDAPSGRAAQVAATGQDGLYEVQVFDKAKPEDREDQFWKLDLSGLPNIRFIRREGGWAAGAIICPAVLDVVEGQARLQTKMLSLGGAVWTWRKTDGPAVPALPGGAGQDKDRPRFQPVPTPDPTPIRIR